VLDLTKGSVIVAAGRGLILSGDRAMQVLKGTVSWAPAGARAASLPVTRPGSAPVARAAQADAWGLGWLIGAIVHRFTTKPRAVTPRAEQAVKQPGWSLRIPVISDLVDALAPVPVADRDGGQIFDLSGGVVGPVNPQSKAVSVKLTNGQIVQLALSQVISTGGGNLQLRLSDGRVISTGGGNVISTGGGNVISTGGGNVISTGGLNVISTGGLNVIATGGGNVISTGGGNVISTGGGNVISTGGGNVISTGGLNFLPMGSGVISTGGGNVISTGGGNVISTGGGNVISVGGGNVISVGGGN
jgi:hypothetical protein